MSRGPSGATDPAPGELDWARHGACTRADPRLFTAPAGATTAATAQQFCARCPVIVQCGRFADRHRVGGLWGGMWRVEGAEGRRYTRYQLLTVAARRVGDQTGGLS